MDKTNEHFEFLEELIRKAYAIIAPYDVDFRLKWLMDKDLRTKHFEKFPKCYLSLRTRGRQVPFFPICNRMGMEDPEIISFSMKLAEKLKDKPEIEGEQIDAVLVKLKGLHSRFNKEIPKPANMAAKKAFVTVLFKKIKSYLDQIKTGTR